MRPEWTAREPGGHRRRSGERWQPALARLRRYLFTTCVNAAELLPTKLLSPLYVAVSSWLPMLLNVNCNVAEPFVTIDVPSFFFPLKNCTWPVGAPAPGEVMDT